MLLFYYLEVLIVYQLHLLLIEWVRKITAYTFHLQDQPSYDATKAAEVAKLMGWDCNIIVVPTNNLQNDFQRLVKEVRCKKKTHFECCFPFLYVYPEIQEMLY